jgi:hypothetical protein
MSFATTRIARAVSAAMLGATLVATAVPAFSQTPGEGARTPRAQMSDADRAQMRTRMQQRMSQRLDRLAARLEIKASQQDAWAQYRKSIESTMQDRPQRPAREADAATLMRFRAEMAQHRAKNLLVLADATAKLQQALDPNQRKVLDEITRSFGRQGRHRGPGGHHHQGPRGGGERGRA